MKQISTKYNEAVQLIKSAILHNQLEAAKAVNRQNNSSCSSMRIKRIRRDKNRIGTKLLSVRIFKRTTITL